MNTTQLLTLLANCPGISAGDMVTALDAKLADVSAELRSLVDVGDVLKQREFDKATGRQWYVYELSDGFKASKAFQQLMTAPAAPAPKVDQVEAPPVPVAQEQRGTTKVSKAIAFVQVNGSASDDQLREAMGLAPKTYVAAYLKAALEAGKLWRDGDTWTIPKEQPLIAPTPERRHENKGPEARTNPSPAMEPPAPTHDAGPTEKPLVAKVSPLTASDCRFAVWSDGRVTIVAPSGTARLTRQEYDAMVQFVNRALA